MIPYYRRNIAVLWMTIFLSSASWNQVYPFLPNFLKEIGGREQFFFWMGVVAAVQSAASIIAQPFWGKMGDTYGRKAMIVRAGVCLTGVYFGMSICHAPWQLALFRFLNGALTGFIPGSFALIATNTPEQLAPRYVASAQVANSAGLIVGPALGSLLFAIFGSFRICMQVSGTVCLLCTLAVLFLVQEPNKTKLTEKTSMKEDFAIALGSPVQRPIMLGVMLAWFYGAAISPYLVVHLQNLQQPLPKMFDGAVYSLPAVAFVLTARFWTGIGERGGYHRAIVIGTVGSAIATALLALMPGIWSFAVMYLITGFWLAAISPSTGALTCTQIDEVFMGRAYGIQGSLGTAAALVAPMLASYVGAYFGIKSIFVMVGVVYLLGAVVFKGMVNRIPVAAECEGELAVRS